MDFRNVLLLVVFILDLVLVYLVFHQNKKSEINVSYALTALWAALWTLGIAIFRASSSHDVQLFWNQEFIFTSGLIASSFLHFSMVFPREEKLKFQKRLFIYLPNVILLWAVLTQGVMIKDIVARDWGNESILGWGYVYFGIYFAFLWLWATNNLLFSYFKSKGIHRLQIIYILVGVSVAIVFGAIFNLLLILLGNYRYIWLGPYASFLFIICTTYAIVRYRLMDIRIVARRAFIYLGVAAFTYAMFYFVTWSYVQVFGSVFASDGYLAGIFIAPTFVALFYWLNKRLQKIANKYFFVSLSNYQDTIAKLTKELNYLIDLKQIVNSIVDTIKQTMQLDRAGVLLMDKTVKPTHYKIAKTIGFNEQNGIALVKDNFLVYHLRKTQALLVRDELNVLIQNARTKKDKAGYLRLKNHMEKIEAHLCLPLFSSGTLIGIIVLGSKISKEAYSKEDLELLDTLSYQAGIAIDNALLYQKVSDLNENLQKKVDEQTADLQQKAEHLEKLLEMRSEFLDIASHQLRTPTSVIIGMTSMLKDEGEKIDREKREKFIDSIFQKSKKLEQIINDILSASEMDTEEFKIDPTLLRPVHVEAILGRIMMDAEEVGAKKGIRVELVKPARPVSEIMAEPRYLEHAISNLVDNAIKYTMRGFVKIVLEEKDKQVRISVQDSGIGIPREDVPKLFGKFSRAKNARQTYTDGSGLGLFIIKKIVDAHKGANIAVESVENKGTTFTLSFPAAIVA